MVRFRVLKVCEFSLTSWCALVGLGVLFLGCDSADYSHPEIRSWGAHDEKEAFRCGALKRMAKTLNQFNVNPKRDGSIEFLNNFVKALIADSGAQAKSYTTLVPTSFSTQAAGASYSKPRVLRLMTNFPEANDPVLFAHAWPESGSESRSCGQTKGVLAEGIAWCGHESDERLLLPTSSQDPGDGVGESVESAWGFFRIEESENGWTLNGAKELTRETCFACHWGKPIVPPYSVWDFWWPTHAMPVAHDDQGIRFELDAMNALLRSNQLGLKSLGLWKDGKSAADVLADTQIGSTRIFDFVVASQNRWMQRELHRLPMHTNHLITSLKPVFGTVSNPGDIGLDQLMTLTGRTDAPAQFRAFSEQWSQSIDQAVELRTQFLFSAGNTAGRSLQGDVNGANRDSGSEGSLRDKYREMIRRSTAAGPNDAWLYALLELGVREPLSWLSFWSTSRFPPNFLQTSWTEIGNQAPRHFRSHYSGAYVALPLFGDPTAFNVWSDLK